MDNIELVELEKAFQEYQETERRYQEFIKREDQWLFKILDDTLDEIEEDMLFEELLDDGLIDLPSSRQKQNQSHTKKNLSEDELAQLVDAAELEYQAFISGYSEAYISGSDWYVGPSLKDFLDKRKKEKECPWNTLKQSQVFGASLFGFLAHN